MHFRLRFSKLLFVIFLTFCSLSVSHAQDTRAPSVSITNDMGGYADQPSISDDGRYIAFRFSTQPPGGGRTDIFVQDRVTGVRQNVTSGAVGNVLNNTGQNPIISGNGRYVLYRTSATSYGTVGAYAYRVFDRINATTDTAIELNTGFSSFTYAAISADGRYVVYRAPVETKYGVFVRDMVAKTTVQVGPLWSLSGMSAGDRLGISADGRFILVPARETPIANKNAVVIDRVTGAIELASINFSGPNGSNADQPSISSDGLSVAFSSQSNSLVQGDTNTNFDVFVRNRVTATTERIISDAGNANMSANARYVVFADRRRISPQAPEEGIHRYDRVTKSMRSVLGTTYLTVSPVASADGRFIAYTQNYSLANRPTGAQIFVADFGPPAGLSASLASLALTEGGIEGTYSLVLTTAPTADVTVTIATGTQLTAARTQLTFTPANWNVPQTASIRAVQDGVSEGAHSAVITHALASTDPAYQATGVTPVNVAITDAVIPTIATSVGAGVVWTQPGLPVHGTAAPGTTVLVSASNMTTNAVVAASTVADASGMWNLTLSGLTDGVYQLRAETNAIGSTIATVTIDSHAPVSTVAISPAAVAGWYASSVQLTISAADAIGGQGVARSEYSINGGAYAMFPAAGLSLATQGSTSVCYRSVDKANNVEVARCVAIAVDTIAPQVAAVFNAVNNTLALSASDSGSGIASVEASLDGGLTWSPYAAPLEFGSDGSHIVQYRARDKAGNQTVGQTTVQVLTTPVIIAPQAGTASEAVMSTFNLGSFTDRSTDGPWAVDVDWGDGSVHTSFSVDAAGVLNPAPHTYADSGSFTVNVKVTDRTGTVGSAVFPVNVLNSAPRAELRVPATALEGATVLVQMLNPIDASAADVLAGFRYAFACDGGSLSNATYANSGTKRIVVCNVGDSGTQTVRARIIDKDGGYTEYTGFMAVSNVAPQAMLSAPSAVVEGGSASVSLSGAIDPSGADTQAGFRYAFACGTESLDGASYATGSTNSSASCSFADGPSVQAVRARIFDKDGGFTEYSTAVSVSNAAPVLGAIEAPASPVFVNTPATVRAGFADSGGADTHTARIDWGDGSVSEGAVNEMLGTGNGVVSGEHLYLLPGNYTIQITLTDKDGGAGSATYGMTIVANEP